MHSTSKAAQASARVDRNTFPVTLKRPLRILVALSGSFLKQVIRLHSVARDTVTVVIHVAEVILSLRKTLFGGLSYQLTASALSWDTPTPERYDSPRANCARRLPCSAAFWHQWAAFKSSCGS